MNEKFFALPTEKQRRILQAGFRVFAQNTYRKCPVGEIAAEAGISKSLLFHYFDNKRELYLYLWQSCVDATQESLHRRTAAAGVPQDLFGLLELGLQAKMDILRDDPEMGLFSVRVFFERDPEVCGEVQRIYEAYRTFTAQSLLSRLDPAQFRPGLDLAMMYREMYLAAEGYLWEMLQNGPLDVPKMTRDTRQLMAFWKSLYLRQPQEGQAGQEPPKAREVQPMSDTQGAKSEKDQDLGREDRDQEQSQDRERDQTRDRDG